GLPAHRRVATLLHRRQPGVPHNHHRAARRRPDGQRRGSCRLARRGPGGHRRPAGHPRVAARGRAALTFGRPAVRMPPGIWRAPWYVVVPAIVVGAATLLPLAYLVIRALEVDPTTLWRLVARQRNLMLLGNTAALTGLVLL